MDMFTIFVVLAAAQMVANIPIVAVGLAYLLVRASKD